MALVHPWAIPLVVALGGLVSGILVFGLAPEVEGHGTDAAIRAVHTSVVSAFTRPGDQEVLRSLLAGPDGPRPHRGAASAG